MTSEEIKPLSKEMKLGIVTHTDKEQFYWVRKDKLKEAIKRLKEEMAESWSNGKERDTVQDIWNKIDKIFGMELVE